MKTYNILFIGNSYTYFNDMPTEYFAKIAESAGYDVNVTAITKGGWTLEKHADTNDECGAAVDAALRDNSYDFVVLQEQSLRPVVNTERFWVSARKLYEKVKANGAAAVFYSTWGRREGSEKLAEFSLTQESMTTKLADAYNAIGKELGACVAHAGLAFYEVYKNSDIELYDPDLSHPSKHGSFLAALTIFAKMFDFDVRKVVFGAGFTEDENKILKEAAYKNGISFR